MVSISKLTESYPGRNWQAGNLPGVPAERKKKKLHKLRIFPHPSPKVDCEHFKNSPFPSSHAHVTLLLPSTHLFPRMVDVALADAGNWGREVPGASLPKVVRLGMLLLLFKGLLELALLAVLANPLALLSIAQCRACPAVGVEMHGAGLLIIHVGHGPVDLVSGANRRRSVAVLVVALLAALSVLCRPVVTGVGQFLMVRVGVTSSGGAVSAVRVGQVLEVDVGAVGVVLALVGCPAVHQGVTLQTGLVPRHRQDRVLLNLLQLFLVMFFVVVRVILAVLAVLVGPVESCPGVAAVGDAVNFLLATVLLEGVVVVSSG